jgi:hypothetical protein
VGAYGSIRLRLLNGYPQRQKKTTLFPIRRSEDAATGRILATEKTKKYKGLESEFFIIQICIFK